MNIRLLIKAVTAALALSIVPPSLNAAIPPAEQVLPQDTLAMLTFPDWSAIRELQKQSTQMQLWNDPAMKPFRDHFAKQWTEEVVEPLEAELGIEFEQYKGLIQGQLTLALLKNDWAGGDEHKPGVVLLLDAGDQSGQLADRLAELRGRWQEKGKSIRIENVRGVDFAVIGLSTNDLPDTLRKFMPGPSDVQVLGDEETPDEPDAPELFIGQAESLLIVTEDRMSADKIMNRVTGGSFPPLADVAQFNRDSARLFRNTHSYGWINAELLVDLIEGGLARQEENREQNAPDPLAQVNAGKIISAMGLAGLKSLAFAYTEQPEGGEVKLFAAVPEADRTGLFKILAGEPKEALPPPFVPADVMQYQRWRLDGQKAYAGLEQMLQDISPQMLSGWNFMINTANLAAQERDPSFDLRQQLMGNLGDDLITYKKPPRSSAPEDIATQPSLFLLKANNPEQFVGALNMMMSVFMQSAPPTEREFLGTTIYRVVMPPLGMSMSGGAGPRTFNMASSRGYVAFSGEDAILEEFLRSADDPVRPLRQIPGFTESTEKVIAPGTSLLSFEDQKETMRLLIQVLRQMSADDTADEQDPMTPIPESLGVGMPRNGLTDWFDFSLLPPFDEIEKYFYHTVYGGGSSSEGLSMTVFSPTPPAMRGQSADSAPGEETGSEAEAESTSESE